MPGSGWITAPPDLTGVGDTGQQVDVIMNYLYVLVEQMRYAMGNLGQENFNDRELAALSKVFTAPVSLQVQGLEGELLSLKGDVDGISLGVTDLTGQLAALRFTINGLQITTQGSSTFISGSSIKSGTIEGAVLSCVMNENHAESEGKIIFYYKENGAAAPVGSLRLSDEITGTESAAQHKVLLQAKGKFVLKLQADADSSYESLTGGIYIKGKNAVMISSAADFVRIVAPNGNQYQFKNDGIYFGGRLIAS